MVFLLTLAFIFSWVGHACIWTSILNNFYGRPWPKIFLRMWRYTTALILIAFPLLPMQIVASDFEAFYAGRPYGFAYYAILTYLPICLIFGAVIFPCITLARLLRKVPTCLLTQQTRTLDLWPELGEQLVGDNKRAAMTRIPFNGVFRVDFTDLTLALSELPAEWDGLTLLVLSDLHFHGSPSRIFFERIIEELGRGATPDLVCLLGDYVDRSE